MNFFAPHLFIYELATQNELVIAGLLVGFGSRLASGCTSGHGVCGIPRLSKRSMISVLVFILSGILTVYIRGLL